jgi:hypothetical protein
MLHTHKNNTGNTLQQIYSYKHLPQSLIHIKRELTDKASAAADNHNNSDSADTTSKRFVTATENVALVSYLAGLD